MSDNWSNDEAGTAGAAQQPAVRTGRTQRVEARELRVSDLVPGFGTLTRVERTVDTIRVSVPWGAGAQTAAFHPSDPVVIAERSH